MKITKHSFAVAVPSWIIFDRNLSLEAKGAAAGLYDLASFLCDLASFLCSDPDTKEKPITVEDFINHFGGYPDEVSNAFHELKKAGYIELNRLCEVVELHSVSVKEVKNGAN